MMEAAGVAVTELFGGQETDGDRLECVEKVIEDGQDGNEKRSKLTERGKYWVKKKKKKKKRIKR